MNTVNQIEEKSHHTELFRGMSKKRLNPEIAEQVFAQMSSKADIYRHLVKHLQYYVCPYTMFTKDYAKDIFAEKKILIRLKHLMKIEVPKYDELSVKNLYKKLLALDNMEKYFPDTYPKGRQCDRDYMFNVANTLHPGVVQELIQHAIRQRHDPKMDHSKMDGIMISEKWMEEFKSFPMVAKKRGKMVHLLKQKSKVQSAQKPRKQFEALDFMKRRKVEDMNMDNVTVRQTPSQTIQQDGKEQKKLK